VNLETNIPDGYSYTLDEIEKNLALAETHAKQYGEVSEVFCADCLKKHFILIEGLSEEGVNFTTDKEEKLKFQKIAEIMKVLKQKIQGLNKEVAFKIADTLRNIRKGLIYNSPKILEVSTKPLNIETPNNDIGNTDFEPEIPKKSFKKGENMVDWKEQGTVVGSQLVGRGIQEVVTMYNQPIFQTITLKNLVGIGVGLVGSLAVIYDKVQTGKVPVAIISSKLLADEIIDLAKTYVPGVAVPARYAAPVRAISPIPASIPASVGGLAQVD